MQKIIRLSYRKIIDHSSQKPWERAVFDASHLEFYMQAQRVDTAGKYETFRQLADQLQAGEQLQYLTSTAVIGYIRQLNDLVPDIPNAHGKLCLPFRNFRFEIIDSHIQEKKQHRIAIVFYSDPLTWIDMVSNQYLIAYGDKSVAIAEGQEVETDLIPMVPFLSISHYSQPQSILTSC